LRHLDWKVYFRHEKHVIKQYEMETNLNCHLLLDISASMRYGDEDQQKLLYASRLATTLAYLIVEQSDRVSLTTFDSKIRGSLPLSNNVRQILKMTESLDSVNATDKTNVTDVLNEFAAGIARRSIVIVVSDFLVDLDGLDETLQRLRYDKHEVVLMQVMHHDEIYFPLEGMIRFIGLEDPDQFLTRPQDIRDGYLEALRKFNSEFTEICEANRCEFITCDTSDELGVTLANYLQQRTIASSL
ncbi:MAG: DUF58 domain-containing protein, partial [Planctomycetaceae bacterium]|nr:DUF58 domain-containing protein [Planctomycetaceae bacterium]